MAYQSVAGSIQFLVNEFSISDRPTLIQNLCRTSLAPWAGKMEPLSSPLGITRLVPTENFPLKPNDKSFIDQTFSVKMAWYWARSTIFCEFRDFDSVSVHKDVKKELGQHPATLISRLVNNPCLVDKVLFPFHVQSSLASPSYGIKIEKPSFCPGHCWRRHYTDQRRRGYYGHWVPGSEAKRRRKLISHITAW